MINFAVGAIGLLIASIYDLKCREIEDYIWISMVIFGFLYSGCLSFVFHDSIYVFQSFVGFIVCFFLGFFMFLLGMGGGDGKLLMGIGALVPKYGMPIYTPLGIILNYHPYIPSFPIMVIINAIFFSIVIPIIVFLKNIIRGVKPKTKKEFMCMFLGEKMRVSEAMKKERLILGNQENLKLLPSAEEDYNFSNFDENEEIWVTPAIPFVVPMFLSYLITPIIGDKIIDVVLSLFGL
ncbi:preflagellin peptidase FlaK [Methanocaldococcus fervens]|uniref:Peptidase A24B, FlaK domain protein n=1 Tax=Methanocaldococcus fervens (strain DSM 4213 / JCM 15782 / AG86) TaxID=573064 RepID=C7P8Y1_METFA|nr:preflagellin peptidase FlaK [Methanocaldococcus fervens]ACV25013.1 Peptidase A24B, FlaK domain protein [Methanocaldococcus fervens AG86]